MKIQKKLSRLGIQKEEELNPKDVNYLAHSIVSYITTTFPVLQEKYNEILAKILNCKMYYAKITENIAQINYIYEDNSIYISDDIDIMEPNEQLYHEIVHYLQVLRKNNGKIKKIGLCDFGDFSVKGLGINEAAVQYISARLMKDEPERVNSFGIELNTISPKFYPLLTNLLEQIIYLLGEDIVVKSALNIDDEFEELLYNTFEEKTNQIIKNFDNILDRKNKLNLSQEKSKQLKDEIVEIYLETQDLIMKKYFDKIVTRLTSIEEIDFYIEKFLNYKKMLGIQEKYKYSFIEKLAEYEENVMQKFDKQLMRISKNKGKNTLSLYNKTLGGFMRKIISYFSN